MLDERLCESLCERSGVGLGEGSVLVNSVEKEIVCNFFYENWMISWVRD
jgi:hypothetical protein